MALHHWYNPNAEDCWLLYLALYPLIFLPKLHVLGHSLVDQVAYFLASLPQRPIVSDHEE